MASPTKVPNVDQEGHAEVVNERKVIALGKKRIPDDHGVMQRKLSAKQKANPAARGGVGIGCGMRRR